MQRNYWLSEVGTKERELVIARKEHILLRNRVR
jgi:hypothetical protein